VIKVVNGAEEGGTAGDVLAAVRRGEVSATDVVSARLELLRRVDSETHAIAAFEDDRAVADARALDRAFARGGVVGPLHGLPITVKDWIDMEGFTCVGESAENRDRRPEVDATVVARLRAAGAVVVAKTRPWGLGAPDGRVRHPLDPARTPGGSSGGEAVVVARGASPLGIGSDSGGSIRLPAAWCGVWGLKPTAGRVPGTGHFPRIGALSDGRTQIGPIARSVDDLELVLGVIEGPDWRDAGVMSSPLLRSAHEGVDGARFATITSEAGWQPHPDLVAAVERAAARLDAAGAVRTQWAAPWLEDSLEITRRYWMRRAASGADADRQLRDWDRYRSRYLQAAEHVELILTPVTLETAPRHRELKGEDFVFMLPASLTGSPAVAVPVGHDQAGMPISVQLVGRPWEDHRVLAAARIVQRNGDE
jgi:amidase